jgi:hypothetical protein
MHKDVAKKFFTGCLFVNVSVADDRVQVQLVSVRAPDVVKRRARGRGLTEVRKRRSLALDTDALSSVNPEEQQGRQGGHACGAANDRWQGDGPGHREAPSWNANLKRDIVRTMLIP